MDEKLYQSELGEVRANTAAPLLDRKTSRRIRCGVIAGHIAVLILPLAMMTVAGWFHKPEPPTITVSFYDPENPNPVDNPSPNPDDSNPIPPSGDPEPPAPPVPAPPVPTPPTPPKINQKLPDFSPAVRPVKITEPKVPKITPPKPPKPPKPEPPKSTPSTDTSAVDKIQPVKPNAGNTSSSTRQGAGKTSNTGSSGGQKGSSQYDILVASFVKRMWSEPTVNRLGSREPEVAILLVILGDGTVQSAKITKKSHVLAMDESVSALLANLRKINPPPPDGKRHEIEFILKITN